MSLIKVAWYVFRVKNMHPGSTSHPSWTAAAEAKPRYDILLVLNKKIGTRISIIAESFTHLNWNWGISRISVLYISLYGK